MTKICEYGCGQEAKHQLKNGKWCCSEKYQRCQNKRKEQSFIRMNLPKKVKQNNGSKNRKRKTWEEIFGKEKSQKMKKNKSEEMSGENHPLYNKKHSRSSIKKMKMSSKMTIEKIKKKYLLFSRIEEMRYNPDKPEEKEIQVHCKYNECVNSKERGGWFNLDRTQLYERIRGVEKTGNDGNYFYCSQKCKSLCPLYGLKFDPFKDIKKVYTPSEINIFINEVLRRQKEEYKFNFCEKCYSIYKLHIHHEKPVKTHPHLALDPDNGIVLCKDCHSKYGHKKGTECSTGNLANKVLLDCTLGSQL